MLPLKQQRGPDLLHLDRRTRTFSSTARGIVFFRRRRLAPPSYARCPPLHGQARTQEQPKREDLLPAPVALLPGGEKEEKEKEVKTEEKEGGRRFSSFVVDVDERRCRILVRLKGSPSHPLLFSSLSLLFRSHLDSQNQVLFWTTTVLTSGGVAARPEDVCYLARETVSRKMKG